MRGQARLWRGAASKEAGVSDPTMPEALQLQHAPAQSVRSKFG